MMLSTSDLPVTLIAIGGKHQRTSELKTIISSKIKEQNADFCPVTSNPVRTG